MSTKADQHLRSSTLAALLQACHGKVTTIELRNEAYVTGKVVEADGYMNVSLEAAIMMDPAGNTLHFDAFTVQNRLIRYVQIPESIDIIQALKEQTEMQAGRGRGRGRGRGQNEFKVSKIRQNLLDRKEKRRQEDIRNAMKMRARNLEEKKES